MPIPNFSLVTITFETKQIVNDVMKYLETAISEQRRSALPRKISVVQNFIALNTNSSEDEGNIVKDNDQEVTIQSEEAESMFGSPVTNQNNTKDTSVFPKNRGRAVSLIIAESTRENVKPFNHQSSLPQLSQMSSLNSSNFVADTLDTALKQIKNNQIPPNVIIESSKSPQKREDKKSDIWDFMSDDNSDSHQVSAVKSKFKSRAMKCLPQTSKSTAIGKSNIASSKKSEKEKKKLKLKVKPVERNITTAPDVHSSSVDQNDPSFSGLTSPIVNIQRRASARAQSTALKTDVKNKKVEVQRTTRSTKKRNLELEEKVLPPKTSSKRNKNKKVSPEPPDLRTTIQKGRNKQPEKKVKKATCLTAAFESNNDPEVPKESPNNLEGKQLTRASDAKDQRDIHVDKAKSNKSHNDLSSHTNEDYVSGSAISQSATAQKLVKNSSVENDKIAPILFEDNNLAYLSAPLAESLLSEAYTNTLQKQIYGSIASFSNQLVKKLQIINEEINKKVMADLTNKYETLFQNLRMSFQNDVDEMCDFIGEVKKLLNLPEQELIDYINSKKFGSVEENLEK